MPQQLLLLSVAIFLALSSSTTTAFVAVPLQSTTGTRLVVQQRETLAATTRTYLNLNPLDNNNDEADLSFDLDCLQAPDSGALHRSLQDRQKALQLNIGKRYVCRCRTQKGFLNVHQEPGDPFDTSNIVSMLTDGDIVVSTGPNRGPWVRHDGGGWSVATFGGFKWLEPLDE